MSRKRKKITVKDLRKFIVNTRKVDGGKIHTINTPNAGPIEIVEGNQHSKGGVNYIKTSDGVTHEIENNEVVLPTDKGPYVVSDYMNTDGTKSYNKNKTSYADLVKYLAMAGATKQDLERVAMETEIANGNDPNNPTSVIKDTNVMKQPKTNQYQQTNKKRRTEGAGWWTNLWGGPKRNEISIGGQDLRLEDKGNQVLTNTLQYDIIDGDTSAVNQFITTSPIENSEHVDKINYNLQSGDLSIVDKSGKTHENIMSGSLPNNPSIFDAGSNIKNIVRTKTTQTPWNQFLYPEVSIHENTVGGAAVYTLHNPHTTSKPTEGAVNTFRAWINDNYPEYAAKHNLDRTGKYNDYVKNALVAHGKDYIDAIETGNFSDKDVSTFEDKEVSQEEMNKLLKKKYQQPYKYKGGGKLKRKYQETDENTPVTDDTYEEVVIDTGIRDHDGTSYKTTFKGDETNIPTDYLFNYDANLSPITADDDNTYADYEMENWTHEDDDTPNLYPTQEEFWAKGFRNVQEWRDWVNTQPGWEKYDWGNLNYWGPKHDEAWKGTRTPVKEKVKVEPDPCDGPNPPAHCKESSFTVHKREGGDPEKDPKDPGNKKEWNWGKIGLLGLGGLAAFGAYKAIKNQMGKTDDMLEAAKKEKPNLIGKQQLGKVELQRISHRSQMVDAIQRGQSMDNSVQAMHIPEGAKYLLKERNTITTQRELNKIKEAENNVNVGISVKEGGLNAQLAMKQAELNTKVDVANQLEQRDIREQKYAAWDRQVAGRQQLISDLIKLGGQGIEAYAMYRSKKSPLTKDPNIK